MKKKPILIIGHGRHGKDTVGEILRDFHGYHFTSSSWFCAGFVAEAMGYNGPGSVQLAYDERANNREAWADWITEYNNPDLTRTASEMLAQGYDLYVGMRKRRELAACMAAGIFDKVLWVDRSLHLPPEPETSMDLTARDATHFINNNGSKVDLFMAVNALIQGG